MDALLYEQHMRSPLRMFPDPLMAQFASGPSPELMSDASSAALLEKARQHLQMWGRSPYSELLLPQMYQRPQNLGALNLGVWQNSASWPASPQLPPGFLPNAAAAAAAVAAAASAGSSRHTSPPPPPQPPATGGPSTPIMPPSAAPLTPTSSSGSPSPDPRAKHFSRFAPYQIPQSHLHQPQAQTSHLPHPISPSPAPARSPSSPSN
uniref:Uncharacterized protein n=1 Tax=Anopheles culicifacies TaxID=139723 RepID=A0A182MME5_9DIPT